MKYILTLFVLSLVASCGEKPQSQQPASGSPEKHPETKKLEAADAAGYDGKMLRESVDKMIDKREEQQKDLDEAQKVPSSSPHNSE